MNLLFEYPQMPEKRVNLYSCIGCALHNSGEQQPHKQGDPTDKGRHRYYPYFTDEKTSIDRSNNFPMTKQLRSGI